jgi:large subunit ribosomal protein L4
LAEGAVTIVSDLALEQPKTKLLAKTLAQLGLAGSVLIVGGEDRTDLHRASRNLPDVKVLAPEALNVYDVLRYTSVVIPERELRRVQEVWA